MRVLRLGYFHEALDALEVADHVYILDAGRNRFDGTPAEVTGEEELMKLYMGVRA